MISIEFPGHQNNRPSCRCLNARALRKRSFRPVAITGHGQLPLHQADQQETVARVRNRAITSMHVSAAVEPAPQVK